MKKILLANVMMVILLPIDMAADATITKTKKNSLPNIEELKTAEGCKLHNEDARRCANAYLNMAANDTSMLKQYLAAYAFNWAENTPDYEITLGGDILEKLFIDKNLKQGTAVAYIMCLISTSIEENAKKLTADVYYKTIVRTMQYYEANKAYFGPSKAIEEALEANKNGTFRKECDESFAKIK